MSDLNQAIQNGNLESVQALLDADPDAAHGTPGSVSPLLLAIYHGRTEIVELLLARGVSLSFVEACAIGRLEEVRTRMVGDRALLGERSPDGHTALGFAIFFRQPEVARFLIEQGADVLAAATNAQRVAPVHAAAAVCDRDTMRMLLDRGADVHAVQQGGYSALHGAASRGDIDMARLLLEHGARRDARGEDGLTPLDVARKYGKVEFADWLEGSSA
jgi:uncharacterized protein